jgi:hypothetical protein
MPVAVHSLRVGPKRGGGLYTEIQGNSRTTLTGGIISSFTNTFMATMERVSELVIRPAGLVAKLIELFGRLDPVNYLQAGKRSAYRGFDRSQSERRET